MCVDVFAPGRAITIEFLHERIYFEAGNNSLSSFEVFDAFIRNDDPARKVTRLRIQFPHFIDLADPDSISIVSSLPLLKREESWFGVFEPSPDQPNIIQAIPSGHNGPPIQGRRIGGKVEIPFEEESDGRRKPIASDTEYLSGMKEIESSVFDLVLDQPITDFNGWLRLRIKPAMWPNDCIISLPAYPFLATPHAFLARVKVVSPGILRNDLECFISTQKPTWSGALVRRGWLLPQTLTRIGEHRLSLVCNSEVEITPMLAVAPSTVLLTSGPHKVESEEVVAPRASRYAHMFITGSYYNEHSDIVRMAQRICRFMTYPMSIEYLVTRFGGVKHEAVGTLLEQMKHSEMLVPVNDAGTGSKEILYLAAQGHDFQRALIELRERYALHREVDPRARRFLQEFLDLHHFCASFTFRWIAFCEEQLENMLKLRLLLESPLVRTCEISDRPMAQVANPLHTRASFQVQIDPSLLTPKPRTLLIVACSKCGDPTLIEYPDVLTYAQELGSVLHVLGGFSVRIIKNPQSTEEFIDEIDHVIQHAGNDGLFVFWYIGHAKPSSGGTGLEFLHARSRERGVAWKTVANAIGSNSGATKVIVLDCCYSGAAAEGLPTGSYLWHTSGANEAAWIHNDKLEPRCFTRSVFEILLEGFVGSPENISFSDLFQRAQSTVRQGPKGAVRDTNVPNASVALNAWLLHRGEREQRNSLASTIVQSFARSDKSQTVVKN